MRRGQLIDVLTGWTNVMHAKVRTLTRAGKIYQLFNYFCKINIGCYTIILLYVNSHLASESLYGFENTRLLLALSLIGLLFQLLLAVFICIDGVMNPKEKSEKCSICQKNYQELLRELSVIICDLYTTHHLEGNDSESDYDGNISEKYNNLALLYSSKEQLILSYEPTITFSRRAVSIDSIEYECEG